MSGRASSTENETTLRTGKCPAAFFEVSGFSQTGQGGPRRSWDTENRNGPLCAYPPRRGLLRCVPTSGHYNRCTRGPDIPPRGLQRTLSRYHTKNYCRTVNAKRFALFPCGMAALTQIKAPKAVTRQSQTRHYTVDVRMRFGQPIGG
jgi:hypothetical protein